MIYLWRNNGPRTPADIQAVTTEARALLFERQGYTRCIVEDWRAVWIWNDKLALWAHRQRERARAVGERPARLVLPWEK